MSARENPTPGEQLLHKRLSKLATDSYSYSIEAFLNTDTSADNPDAIVACWEHGVVVIEVKDWKRILNETNQDTFVIRTGDGEILRLKNPSHTVRNYATSLADLLEKQPELRTHYKGNKSLVVPWQPMIIFSNLPDIFVRNLEKEGILTKGIAYGKEALESQEAFEKSLENLPWRFPLNRPLADQQKAVIRRIIKPSLAIGDYGTLSPLQEILSEEALQVSENASVRLVRGVAGSGKSLVLVRRVQYLNENYPEKKLLVLTFNDKLADDLKERVDIRDVDVMTFHKLCASIIKKHGTWRSPNNLRGWLQRHEAQAIEDAKLSIDFVKDEIEWRKDTDLFDNDQYLTIQRKGRGTALQQPQREAINAIFTRYKDYQIVQRDNQQVWQDWADVPWIALNRLEKNKSNPFRRAYDVILLDEAQDFAPSWLIVIKRLLKPNGTLFLCDDPTQSLFKRFSWQEKGIPVRGKTRILRVPFRSTREISMAAHSLIQNDPILSQSSDITKPILETDEIRSGEIPFFAVLPDKESEVLFIYDEINNMLEQGIQPHEIAILYREYSDKENWEAHEKLNIHVIRYGQMKGLEFRVVILPFVGSIFEPGRNEQATDEFIRERKIELFTAMSRARQLLMMSHHAQYPRELDCIKPYIYPEFINA